MAKKTVNKLKHKHRDRIWLDSEGEIWFYQPFCGWKTLVSLTYNHDRESQGFLPVPHQVEQDTVAPFTYVATAVYHEDE